MSPEAGLQKKEMKGTVLTKLGAPGCPLGHGCICDAWGRAQPLQSQATQNLWAQLPGGLAHRWGRDASPSTLSVLSWLIVPNT